MERRSQVFHKIFCGAAFALFVSSNPVAADCPSLEQSGTRLVVEGTVADIYPTSEDTIVIHIKECPIDLFLDRVKVQENACAKGAWIAAEGVFDACAAYLDADCVATISDTLFEADLISCTP